MKEKGGIPERLFSILNPRKTETQALLTTLGESVFSGMDWHEQNLVKKTLDSFSPHYPECPERLLEKFGISAQKTAEQYYILRYIKTAADVGNIEYKLTHATGNRYKLKKEKAGAITSLYSLEQELQSNPQRKSVLPQDLKELRLSREEIENARRIAESQYKLTHSSPKQVSPYLIDDQHTSIPALPSEQAFIIPYTSDCDKLIPVKDFLQQALNLDRNKSSEDIPQNQSSIGQLSILLMKRGFQQVSGNFTPDEDILSRLGLTFDDQLFSYYAKRYIDTMAFIKTLQSFPEELLPEQVRKRVIAEGKERLDRNEDQYMIDTHLYPGMSRQQMMQIREQVEEAFRTDPNAFATNNPTDQQQLYY